jgi:Bacterial Ig-like domain (group 2).
MMTWIMDWIIDNVELVLMLEGDGLILGFRRRSKAFSIKFQVDGKDITMLEMTDTQQVPVSLVINDKKGHPARIDGTPEWLSSDPAVATVDEIAADGLSATVKAVDTGVCQITVSVDADLGAGSTKAITGFLDVTINAGEAAVVELQAGTPVEQA